MINRDITRLKEEQERLKQRQEELETLRNLHAARVKPKKKKKIAEIPVVVDEPEPSPEPEKPILSQDEINKIGELIFKLKMKSIRRLQLIQLLKFLSYESIYFIRILFNSEI